MIKTLKFKWSMTIKRNTNINVYMTDNLKGNWSQQL